MKKGNRNIKPEKMHVQTYLFDLDGTLIDTAIYAKIYSPLLAMIQRKKKISLRQIVTKAKQWKVKKNLSGRYDTGDLCRKFNLLPEYYRVLWHHLTKNPILKQHVVSTFRRLTKEHKTIGVISNSMRKTVELYLTEYALVSFVDFVYCSEDAKIRKSHPFFWKKLCKKHHLKPSECMVIGDDPQEDFMLPERLGFHTFLVLRENDLERVA